MKKRYLIYIMLIWGILVFPFAGMICWTTNETTENTELAEWPELKENGRWNKNFLSDAGSYFEDHFAFRQYMVTANSELYGAVFHMSPISKVVVGKKGWLYFDGTLKDYQGTDVFTEREYFAVVHNLSLIQQYVEQQGSKFFLTIAPNKNSLYGEYMPYYLKSGSERNMSELPKRLKNAGINYVDLFTAFGNQDEILYFKRDSHWNVKGAVLAYNVLADAMEMEHETYLNVPVEQVRMHRGDLDLMLYPLAAEKENDYIYNNVWKHFYVNNVSDNMDEWIEPCHPEKTGTLLMYRDSFGESLLPFFAEAVNKGYFSRLVPYNLTQIEQYNPDYVIIERVEREISDFMKKAPIMEPVVVENILTLENKTDSTITAEKQGSYLMVSGKIDSDYIEDETEIFVSIRDNDSMETKTYPVFYIQSGEGEISGYQVYLKGRSVPIGNIHINTIVENEGQFVIVASQDTNWE